MIRLLADENFEGHAARLMARLLSAAWRDTWDAYGFQFLPFDESGLARGTSDDVVYATCQSERCVLLTANRNDDGPASLETAIRTGGPRDLPVATVADPDRVMTDRSYAEFVAEQLLEVLTDIVDRPETILGTGRVYVPRRPVP